MKMGMRKPSVGRSVRARTTGKVKRAAKKAVDPTYGKKGMGVIKDPERAAKNAIYKRTTVGLSDVAGHPKKGSGAKGSQSNPDYDDELDPSTLYEGSGHTYEESLEYAREAMRKESSESDDGIVLGGCAAMIFIMIALVVMWLESCATSF